MKHQELSLNPSNRAAITKTVSWPYENKSCMFLSFDFDAESAWTDENADESHKLVTMSYGAYGARVGLQKILELLEDLGLSATFFVPGWVVETYTDLCESILEGGHEIGHHGYYHLKPSLAEQEVFYEEIDKGFEVLKKHLGVTPVGYRAPCGENYSIFLKYLRDKGIKYSSSFRDDISPYHHVLGANSSGLLELPANSAFDDWTHSVTKGSSRNMASREQILSIWKDELEQMHRWGGLTTTVLHPQVSGRPSRFMILEQFLAHALEFKDLWISKGELIEKHISSQTNMPCNNA